MDHLKYPIGTYSFDPSTGMKEINNWIADIERLPDRVTQAVIDLDEEKLNTPYRPEGWTIRQVVHHLADSHMNALIRTKLLLTEDKPIIKPFNENSWAELRDNELAVQPSLDILNGVHRRWVRLLEFARDDDWNRELNHPENGAMTLKQLTAHYAWHGNHHLAHITTLIDRKNW